MEHSVSVEDGKERTVSHRRKRVDLAGLCAQFDTFSEKNFFDGLVGFIE
jgi:hypothetical protein